MNILNNLGLEFDELLKVIGKPNQGKLNTVAFDVYLHDAGKDVIGIMKASANSNHYDGLEGEVWQLGAWSTLESGFLKGFCAYGYVHEYSDTVNDEDDECMEKISRILFAENPLNIYIDFAKCGEDKDATFDIYQSHNVLRSMLLTYAFPIIVANDLGYIPDASNELIEICKNHMEGYEYAIYVRGQENDQDAK